MSSMVLRREMNFWIGTSPPSRLGRERSQRDERLLQRSSEWSARTHRVGDFAHGLGGPGGNGAGVDQ